MCVKNFKCIYLSSSQHQLRIISNVNRFDVNVCLYASKLAHSLFAWNTHAVLVSVVQTSCCVHMQACNVTSSTFTAITHSHVLRTSNLPSGFLNSIHPLDSVSYLTFIDLMFSQNRIASKNRELAFKKAFVNVVHAINNPVNSHKARGMFIMIYNLYLGKKRVTMSIRLLWV